MIRMTERVIALAHNLEACPTCGTDLFYCIPCRAMLSLLDYLDTIRPPLPESA